MIQDLKHKKIVFFDGHCNLCNGFVNFLIKRDTKKLLLYSTLKGQAAKDFGIKGCTSVQFYNDGKLSSKSSAALNILYELSGFYRLLYYFLILFPRLFRDLIYDFIAANRYKWFGETETCRVPNKQEQELFI